MKDEVHRYSTATVARITEVAEVNVGHPTEFVLAIRPQAAVFPIRQGIDGQGRRIVGLLLIGGTASQFAHHLETHRAYQETHGRVTGECWHLAAPGVYDDRGERKMSEGDHPRQGDRPEGLISPEWISAMEGFIAETFGSEEEPDLSFLGTCQRCGAYWDARQHTTCPAPCGGQVL